MPTVNLKKSKYINKKTGQVSDKPVPERGITQDFNPIKPVTMEEAKADRQADESKKLGEGGSDNALIETKKLATDLGYKQEGETLSPEVLQAVNQRIKQGQELASQVPTTLNETGTSYGQDIGSQTSPESNTGENLVVAGGLAAGTGLLATGIGAPIGAAAITGTGIIAAVLAAGKVLDRVNFDVQNKRQVAATKLDGSISSLSKLTKGVNSGGDPDAAVREWNQALRRIKETEMELKRLQSKDIKLFQDSGADVELERINQFRIDYASYAARFNQALIRPNPALALQQDVGELTA